MSHERTTQDSHAVSLGVIFVLIASCMHCIHVCLHPSCVYIHQSVCTNSMNFNKHPNHPPHPPFPSHTRIFSNSTAPSPRESPRVLPYRHGDASKPLLLVPPMADLMCSDLICSAPAAPEKTRAPQQEHLGTPVQLLQQYMALDAV